MNKNFNFLIVLFFLFLNASASPIPSAVKALTTIYVASSGSDSNLGTIDSPLLTIAAAVSASASGATINLKAGDTFAEKITLTSGRTIQSYGTGQAIVQTVGTAFQATDCDGITLSNLKFVNTATGGVVIYFSSTDGVRRTGGVTIKDCETSGGSIGIRFLGAPGNDGGWNGVTIKNNHVHDAVYGGMYLAQSDNSGSNKHYSNVLIEGNTVHAISGSSGTGSGIVLGTSDSKTGTGAAQCIIRKNHVYDCGKLNGGVAGPAGIFPLYSDSVLVEGNLVHDIYTSSIGNDGDALDADMGTTNCIFQGNYCYNCQGPGFLLFSDGDGHVVRWNVFANCGTSTFPNLFSINIYGNGSCKIYNNTIYSISATNAALGVTGSSGRTLNKKIFNNIFVSPSGVPILNLPLLDNTFLLEGNSYQTSNNTFLAKYNGTTYNSLAAFRTASGRETGHGFTTSDPFVGYGSAIPMITDPSLIPTLKAFDLPSGSPLSGTGLDLKSKYSVDPGPIDFKGQTISVPYSVGAVNSSAITSVFPTADINEIFNVYPNPVEEGSMVIDLQESIDEAVKVDLYNSIGEQVYHKVFSQSDSGMINVDCGKNLNTGPYILLVSLKDSVLKKTVIIK